MLAARPGELRLSCSEATWQGHGPRFLAGLWLVLGSGSHQPDAWEADHILSSFFGHANISHTHRIDDCHLVLGARVKSGSQCVDCDRGP